MKRNAAKFALLFCAAAMFLSPCTHRFSAKAAAPSLAECVMEASSKRFLWQKNAATDLPMASTTKILTAILILDDCDLKERVCIPQEAAGTEGSSVYLRAGEVYTVEELLYGLMLRSGNDCAVALALHHSGSIETFAQAMNEKAARLGAEHSHFVNPHGLPDKRHYTTARDLALIAAYAMENETFSSIVSCAYYAPRGWKNKNKMLREYEGATGIKTGFTLSAGRCLVTSAERGGMNLICVVLNSPEMYERSAELLDGAFETYFMYSLCDRKTPVCGFYPARELRYPLTKAEREKIVYRFKPSDAPPEKGGDFAGILEIYLANRLLFSQNLYMMKA